MRAAVALQLVSSLISMSPSRADVFRKSVIKSKYLNVGRFLANSKKEEFPVTDTAVSYSSSSLLCGISF
jgi:hypothetical protein